MINDPILQQNSEEGNVTIAPALTGADTAALEINAKLNTFFAHLHRGGDWAYWWTLPDKVTTWYQVGDPRPLPAGKVNIYFSVHPTTQIPTTNTEGEKKPPEAVRSQIPYIAVINCLYSEFDENKGATLDQIADLPVMPSVLIRSGGGWHAYWLLRDPFILTSDADRERAKELQANWVTFTGGDTGAKDLAHVLRVPGTLNYKYDPPRPVTFVWDDPNLLHDLEYLENLCRSYQPEAPTSPAVNRNGHKSADSGDYWLVQARLKAAVGNRNDTGLWLACQLRDARITEEEARPIMLQYVSDVPQAPGEPYDDREALASLKNAYSKPPREPARGMHSAAETATYKLKSTLGEHVSEKDAAIIEAQAQTIPCPDPELAFQINEILTAPKILKRIKMQAAGRLVLNWLSSNGEFIRNDTDDIYYLYKAERKLYNLVTNHWKAWLYSLIGVNPAGNEFAYFQADCETAALLSRSRPVLKMAAWDKTTKVLRVSRFDGTVYCLNGTEITEEGNGESVLFDDSPIWQPYKPDFTHPGTFAFMADSYFDGGKEEREQYKLALRVWELSTFFTELCPTRTILVIYGEKGSGKSMTIRRFLRSLYGSNAELSGVPDKKDGFTAAAAATHIYAIDNLDEFQGWMRDKIAMLSTGGIDEYRKLFTNNQVGTVRYRCWLAFTSRTPDTLRRDDLADRLVLLPVKRIPEEGLKAERYFLDAAEITRNAWWGDLLLNLNGLVADLRAGKLKSQAKLRMADWESFGQMVAAKEGTTEIWDEFITNLKEAQTSFVLDGDLVAEELLDWLQKNSYGVGMFEWIRSGELYEKLSDKYAGRKPPKDWPSSSLGFGKRLQQIREALTAMVGIEFKHDSRSGWQYRFWKKDD